MNSNILTPQKPHSVTITSLHDLAELGVVRVGQPFPAAVVNATAFAAFSLSPALSPTFALPFHSLLPFAAGDLISQSREGISYRIRLSRTH